MNALNVDIDTAVPLGLIVNELLTNTIKYAFPDWTKRKSADQIRAKIKRCFANADI
jgi:two-component sensor histidine kinase